MSDAHTESVQADAGIDLSQFYQVFFEEAGENLDNMEQLLLNVNVEAADDEVVGHAGAPERGAHDVRARGAAFTVFVSDDAKYASGTMALPTKPPSSRPGNHDLTSDQSMPSRAACRRSAAPWMSSPATATPHGSRNWPAAVP